MKKARHSGQHHGCDLPHRLSHRGAEQIMPPTRRCCFVAELTAKPTLQEPVCLVVIACPQETMSGVCNCMNSWCGCIFEENPVRVRHALGSRSSSTCMSQQRLRLRCGRCRPKAYDVYSEVPHGTRVCPMCF